MQHEPKLLTTQFSKKVCSLDGKRATYRDYGDIYQCEGCGRHYVVASALRNGTPYFSSITFWNHPILWVKLRFDNVKFKE